MLVELRIRDFAIIDQVELAFGPGFSVLTGETGAGKSIIIDAVELVLGGRADSTFVRAGADRAMIEALFRLNPTQREAIDPVLKREELGGDEPDLLSLGREVRPDGRSVSRVNGRRVTLTLLRELAEGLVDIHGQSEHLSLMRVHEHVNLLDRYAGLWPLRAQVAELVEETRRARRELENLLRSEQELAHRADLLQFQINEIAIADPQPGEDQDLIEEQSRLANAEQLAELVGETLRAIEVGEGETPTALDLLGSALRALEGLTRIDATLEPQLRAAESASYQVEELVRNLNEYQEKIEHNPQRLQEVQGRLALIRQLQRKYGTTIPDVLAYADKAAQELDGITHSEERIAELRVEEERLLARLEGLALELSRQRQEAAQQLAVGIEEELGDLRMEGARFGADFQWRQDTQGVPLSEAISALSVQVTGSGIETPETQEVRPENELRLAFDSTGIDHVEFLVSPNPGEPLKPLAKIASGGETSRLMLALKAVLSRADRTPTLIFDEIDQGIGGRVGATVGEKLWGLALGAGPDSLHHQVLCVTHLPQLAGFGDVHFHVEKQVEQTESGERTVTRIRQLAGEAQVIELAQMIGGGGQAAHLSAQEILDHVAEHKSQDAGRRKQDAGDRELIGRSS